MLTKKQMKLNDFVLKEAGLELDEANHVIDQDTGLPIMIKDKYVKYNNGPVVRLLNNEVEFDPLNNPYLSNEICGNYINKLCMEGEINSTAYGISNRERNNEGVAMCITDTSKISSKKYNLDSLKYIDLIATLNNTDTDSKESIKLKSYDEKEPPKPTRRKTKPRRPLNGYKFTNR